MLTQNKCVIVKYTGDQYRLLRFISFEIVSTTFVIDCIQSININCNLISFSWTVSIVQITLVYRQWTRLVALDLIWLWISEFQDFVWILEEMTLENLKKITYNQYWLNWARNGVRFTLKFLPFFIVLKNLAQDFEITGWNFL